MSISLYQELLCILFMIKYYSRLGNADNTVAHTVGSVHFDHTFPHTIFCKPYALPSHLNTAAEISL